MQDENYKSLTKKRSLEFLPLRSILGFECVGARTSLLESRSGVHLNWRRRYSVIVLFLHSCITSGMNFPFTLGFGELSHSEGELTVCFG